MAVAKMAAMKMFHLKNCDSCRAARKALSDRDPVLVDVRDDGLGIDDVDTLLAAVGADVLINRKSRTWRSLSAQEQARQARELLVEYPTLMKRPVIVDGADILVGWTTQTRRHLGLE